MIDKANAESAAAGNPMSITHDGRGANMPATSISWFEAAQFVNWLNTSKGHTPAYKFDNMDNFQLWEPSDLGYNPANLFRNSEATYFLPSVDEWYKAAYYDPSSGVYFNYPTGSNTPPTPVASGTASGTAVYQQGFLGGGPAEITQAGGLSPYGTMAQGGNALELTETEFDLVNDNRLSARRVRGGSWSFGANDMLALAGTSSFSPSSTRPTNGFRVASIVPEPSTLLLLGIGLAGMFGLRRRIARSGVPIRHRSL